MHPWSLGRNHQQTAKKKISDSLDTNDRELAVLTKQQHNSFLQASGMREMHLYVVMMLAKNDC
jgi:hypothetical protein